jgi:hypothetical protein
MHVVGGMICDGFGAARRSAPAAAMSGSKPPLAESASGALIAAPVNGENRLLY